MSLGPNTVANRDGVQLPREVASHKTEGNKGTVTK